jgi:bifunctional DNA-binding transcriptional regulator/antitoxin component of YhaV-PrlF toxin-antitoxin module
MPELRHTRRVGTSIVVALPRSIRHHVGIERGDLVYWYTTRTGEAVLSKHAKRTGGHPEGLALRRQLEEARAEVERLRRKSGARPLAVFHEGYTEGRMAHMGELIKLGVKLDALAAEVHALRTGAPRTARARRSRTVVTVGDVSDVGAPPTSTPPSNPSPPGPDEQGAATSGEHPPGGPPENQQGIDRDGEPHAGAGDA